MSVVLLSLVRFVKRMCRSLGLLQDSAETEEADLGASFAVTRRLSSRRDFTGTGSGNDFSRKDRFKHKLLGGMDAMRHADPHLSEVLQTCMLVGRWVLIEAIGTELAPCLIDAILAASQRSKVAQARSTGSPLACDALLDGNVPSVHPDFQLILATPSSVCQYPPEVCTVSDDGMLSVVPSEAAWFSSQIIANVTVVNFAVCADSLRESFLQLVTLHELPSLEVQRDTLLVSMADMLQGIQDNEAKLIDSLSRDLGDSVLDDADVLSTIETCCVSSKQLQHQLVLRQENAEELSRSRLQLSPFADVCVAVFEVVQSLPFLANMYVYSLEWMEERVLEALITVEYEDCNCPAVAIDDIVAQWKRSHPTIDARMLGNLSDAIRVLVNNVVTRCVTGVRREHQLPVQLAVCRALEVLSVPSDSHHVKRWDRMWGGATEGSFQAKDSVLATSLEKVIACKTDRPAEFSGAALSHVALSLGTIATDASVSLRQAFGLCTAKSPFVVLLDSGLDPLTEIEGVVAADGMSSKFTMVSLGQGQGSYASRAIRHAARNGTWVMLSNCHLYPSWMQTLEAVFSDIQSSCSDDFRLILTTLPFDEFPRNVLSVSVKYAMLRNPNIRDVMRVSTWCA
jgi:hypothetical protein